MYPRFHWKLHSQFIWNSAPEMWPLVIYQCKSTPKIHDVMFDPWGLSEYGPTLPEPPPWFCYMFGTYTLVEIQGFWFFLQAFSDTINILPHSKYPPDLRLSFFFLLCLKPAKWGTSHLNVYQERRKKGGKSHQKGSTTVWLTQLIYHLTNPTKYFQDKPSVPNLSPVVHTRLGSINTNWVHLKLHFRKNMKNILPGIFDIFLSFMCRESKTKNYKEGQLKWEEKLLPVC